MSNQRVSRLLHTTARLHKRPDLIGPTDPHSNLRPVLYGGIPPPVSTNEGNGYSQEEIAGTQRDPEEFRLNIAKAQLDAFNHSYWADSNYRFHFAQEAYFRDKQPSESLNLTKEQLEQHNQRLQSEFYALWVAQEKPRQKEYSRRWLRGQYGIVMMSASLHIRRMVQRVFPWNS